MRQLEYAMLIVCCFLVIGCAIKYQESTFFHAKSIDSFQYGNIQDVTINHIGNWTS